MNTIEMARRKMAGALRRIYEPGEAASVTRIVFEDALLIHGQQDGNFTPLQVKAFDQALKLLLKGNPVQYVVGKALFCGLYFKVTPDVLIPRPETEELVYWILEHVDHPAPCMLDIGLGSGCIGITLQKKIPTATVHGMEYSEAALRIARENAQAIVPDAAARFIQADATDPGAWMALPQFDVIVSNPPYIPRSERMLMDDRVWKHEPELALFVPEEDPLIFFRAIAALSREKLNPHGLLFFECNTSQAIHVADIMREMGYKQVTLRADMSGNNRMVMGSTFVR
jgi:release factor glutamine methyltransferase